MKFCLKNFPAETEIYQIGTLTLCDAVLYLFTSGGNSSSSSPNKATVGCGGGSVQRLV
jgi:hypothetical protein